MQSGGIILWYPASLLEGAATESRLSRYLRNINVLIEYLSETLGIFANIDVFRDWDF